MRLYAVQSADPGDVAVAEGAARDARAAAMARRRQLSQGKQALNAAGAPPAAENPQANGAERAPAAHGGRTISMQRRRQLSQGKQALNGGGANAPALVVYRGGAG
jgi:small-conductance mechanosensitive channel